MFKFMWFIFLIGFVWLAFYIHSIAEKEEARQNTILDKLTDIEDTLNGEEDQSTDL